MAQLSTKRILSGREETLVSLRKQHTGLMKKIKTERTKLDTFKEDVRMISGKSHGMMQAKLQELRDAKNAFKAVLERCAKSRIFTNQEKKQLFWLQKDLDEMAADTFGDGMNMSDEELEELVRRAAEERAKQGFDFFERFTPPVPEAEQRSIREVYKRLAARFHPDKAAGKAAVEQRFHAIMQRINTSYQRGDIADLLALEAEYTDVVDILQQADSPLVDVVEREIERVRNEIDLCERQLERLKTERKSVERTQDGKMVKDFKKAEKQGLDPIAEMTQDFDRSIEAMQQQTDLFGKLLAGEISKDQLTEELIKLNEMDGFDDADVGGMPFDGLNISEEELFEILNMMEAQVQAYEQTQRRSGGARNGSGRGSWQKSGRGRSK